MKQSIATLEPSCHFIEELAENFDLLKFSKNQMLYSEGSTPLGVFFLQQGEVLISKLASQGKEQVLRVISEKTILCCADLLLNRRYGSSARATKESSVLFIPRDYFLEMLTENREAGMQIMKQLANEVTSLENEVASLAYKPLRGRLADKLLNLNLICEKTSERGICMSRTDLAGYTGTVKETVNRVLAEFQKEEMISIFEKQIRILDKNRLRKISQMYD